MSLLCPHGRLIVRQKPLPRLTREELTIFEKYRRESLVPETMVPWEGEVILGRDLVGARVIYGISAGVPMTIAGEKCTSLSVGELIAVSGINHRFQLKNSHIIIRPRPRYSSSLIILPSRLEADQDAGFLADVLEVGEGIPDRDGRPQPMAVKVGDAVIVSQFAQPYSIQPIGPDFCGELIVRSLYAQARAGDGRPIPGVVDAGDVLALVAEEAAPAAQ